MVLAASGKKTPGITTALTYGCFETHAKPNSKAQLCVVARRYLVVYSRSLTSHLSELLPTPMPEV
jgi:hypothetical protein